MRRSFKNHAKRFMAGRFRPYFRNHNDRLRFDPKAKYMAYFDSGQYGWRGKMISFYKIPNPVYYSISFYPSTTKEPRFRVGKYIKAPRFIGNK
jgi:hypothetical protein